MIETILYCYLLLVLGYIIFLKQLYSPGKHLIARKIVGTLLGMKYLGAKDIEFQSGVYDCGVAAVKMLFKKIHYSGAMATFNDRDRRSGHTMMRMSDICLFLKNNGFASKGYEFINKDQLKATLNEGGKKYSLLLMKSVDAYSGLTPSFILLFPFILVKRALFSVKLIRGEIFHWVLLDELDGKGVTYCDPLFGRVLVKRSRFERMWTKYGVVVDI